MSNIMQTLADNPLAGLEDVTAQDLLTPRLTILQKLSPQLDDQNAAFIEGAKAGQICNTALATSYDKVIFIPCQYRKAWVEWAPRSEGRGIVQVHESAEVLKRCTYVDGKPMLDDNSIVETAQFYGLQCLIDDGLQPAFIAMTSSQLKAAKKWLHIAMSSVIKVKENNGWKKTPAPLYAYGYELTTQVQTNKQGSWYGWAISRADDVSALAKVVKVPADQVVDQCQSFRQSVLANAALPTNGHDAPAIEGPAGEAPPF